VQQAHDFGIVIDREEDSPFETVEPPGALLRRPFDDPPVQLLEIGFRAARNLNAV
jgi:hypothetical protein